MRTAMTLLALSLALSATAACKKKKPVDSAAGSGSETMAGSSMAGSSMAGSAAAGSGSDTMAGSGSDTGSGSGSAAEVAMPRQAGNCPSTVYGSTTKAELKGKDVILTITATDKDAIAAIQKRTEELLKEKAEGGPSGSTHDQKGSFGGGKGICPVYWTEGGAAKAKQDAKGMVVTITPKEKPEELKATIDDRITKAADWLKTNVPAGDQGNKGGVGGGKGDHGSTHSGSGDAKGKDRKEGKGGGAGTGGGGGKGTGGGGEKGSGSGT